MAAELEGEYVRAGNTPGIDNHSLSSRTWRTSLLDAPGVLWGQWGDVRKGTRQRRGRSRGGSSAEMGDFTVDVALANNHRDSILLSNSY